MSAKTVGFATADQDRAQLDRLVERFGHGNRSEFLRAAMKVMAVEDRAARLRDVQARAGQAIGRVVDAAEVTDLVARVLAQYRAL